MGKYIVIENTPGYMPDDDEPFETDDYEQAVAYLNERAAEYADDPDAEYEVEYGWASGNNFAAVMVWDRSKTHDLGRYIGVELNEEDDDPMTYKSKGETMATEWIIQGNYGYGDGWEDLSAYETRDAAKEDLRLYRENEPEYAHRLIARRVKALAE